jgi:polyisoprenoid-binding protein YceI
MKKTILNTIIIAGIIAGFTVASGFAQLSPRNLSLAKGSRLWIEGTSTVRSFNCTATKVDVNVVAEPGVAPDDLVQSALLVVPVASLDCRNETMNEHMRKALKAKDNPQISWKMDDYKVDGMNILITGRLAIAGKENPIEIHGTGTADASGTVRLKGSKQFKMSEYGVKPPSLMLGTMKVRDSITVSFDLVLNP